MYEPMQNEMLPKLRLDSGVKLVVSKQRMVYVEREAKWHLKTRPKYLNGNYKNQSTQIWKFMRPFRVPGKIRQNLIWRSQIKFKINSPAFGNERIRGVTRGKGRQAARNPDGWGRTPKVSSLAFPTAATAANLNAIPRVWV